MQLPLQVSFRHMEHSEPIEALIRERVAKLVALRDTFDSARRKLEDYVRRRRGAVKTLDTAPHGRLCKLLPTKGYGFIMTPDGREIYFHRNSVLHEGFSHLKIGTDVTFVEEEGQKGPQASTVKPVGKHHHLR